MFNSLRLTVTSPNKAFTHTALEENAVKIGRSLKCDFPVPLEDISREHCLFEIVDGEYFITDLGSSNGVWVDRERIPVNTRVKITESSHVVLSNLYQLSVNPLEIKTKSDIKLSTNSGIKKVDPEVKTITFQLEFPEEKKDKSMPLARMMRKATKEQNETFEEKENQSAEHLKMIIGFALVAAAVIYHFVTSNN